MKTKIFVRVGCTFAVDCPNTPQAIKAAVQKQIETIPFLDGDTYIPFQDVTDLETGDEITIDNDIELGELTYNPNHPAPEDYFLFGPEACAILEEEGFDELVELIQNDQLYFETYSFVNTPGNLSELLAKIAEFGDYCYLTPDQYQTLSALE